MQTKTESNNYSAPTRVAEYIIQLFEFIKRVDKGGLNTVKDLKSWLLKRYPFVICSDEGSTFETSAFLS